VQQAFVGALVLEAHFAALAEDRGDFVDAQFGGFLDRPIHALATGQALTEVDLQRRFAWPAKLSVSCTRRVFADLSSVARNSWPEPSNSCTASPSPMRSTRLM
jgi:hypothetical protein